MYGVGTTVISLKGECDRDENDELRETGPYAEGMITDVDKRDSGDIFSVEFENGTWVFLSAAELADRGRYTVHPLTDEMILTQAKSRFPGQSVSIRVDPETGGRGIVVGSEGEHCYRVELLANGRLEFEQVD